MKNIFYTPDINGNTYMLDEQESKHCIKVLRHDKGDQILLIDGRGNWYHAKIAEANSKRCLVEVVEVKQEKSGRVHYSHIAVAPTKNIERFEWFLEKAVELGIDEVTPIFCDHSERKNINYERLEKIIISAIKQSMKATMPKLNKMVNLETLISIGKESHRFIAHCSKGEKIHLFDAVPVGAKSLVLIGPEGDFSEREIDLARVNRFIDVSLGESRLRTETAGVSACLCVNLKNESKK